ncbi:MAG: TPR end-of-group domain-containing protein [Candidatus Dormibacteraceae bacterium]
MKRELLDALAEGRAREAELESLCVDGPVDSLGRWSARDHIFHLAWWRDRNARLMSAVRTGSELPPPLEDDDQNAIIYTSGRHRPAADVRAVARDSWDRLAAAVEACSEDDLIRPHPYATDRRLWESVPGNGHGHVAEHLMFWHLELGDEKSAEAAQVWAHDLNRDLAPDPAHRAYADYNLACFYGRVGRADKAAPLLRESLKARPELVAQARKDKDLDLIRTSDKMRELLG